MLLHKRLGPVPSSTRQTLLAPPLLATTRPSPLSSSLRAPLRHCQAPTPSTSSRQHRTSHRVSASSVDAGAGPSAPAALQDSLARVQLLRDEREKALQRLRAIDAQLREETFREREILGASLPAMAGPKPGGGAAAGGEEGAEAAGGPLHNPVAASGVGDGLELDNFGYVRTFAGEPYDYTKPMGVPGGLLEMGTENFLREGRAILSALGFKLPPSRRGESGAAPPKETEQMKERQQILSSMTLSNQAIWDREHARPQVQSPWLIKVPYYVLCWVLDVIYENRPIPRFWLLETVARMPYFSYINMLHLYESLGWWRRSMEARKVHFAEEWNEAHHLLIMESLGGDQRWADRFVAQHAAIVYYFVLLLLWIASPTLAYNFSELIEAHAVDTYSQFLDENEAALKQLPPPRVARLYYDAEDMYLFNEFQTERDPGDRFVSPGTLYDVFCNIRDDEAEHVATMHAMQRQDVLSRAPNIEAAVAGLVTLVVGLNLWLPRLDNVAELEERSVLVESMSWAVETLTAVLTDALALLVGL